MAHAPRPLPEGLGAVFTLDDARAAGLTAGRLRARDLETPFRGIRQRIIVADDDEDGPLALDRAVQASVRRSAEAYRPLMAAVPFICGRSAAVLYGGPVEPGADLDVGVLAPARAPRRQGKRGRKIAPHLVNVIQRDALPTSTPASTWAMLASELDVDDLIRLGDALVRIPRDDRGRPRPEQQLTTPIALRKAVDAGRRVGGEKLRRALEEIRVGAMSPLETDYRLVTCRAGLPEPDLDVEMRDSRGRLLGIADAAYRAHRVLVEVDGGHHRTDARQWARDLERHAAFTAEGWDVVRVTAVHVRGAESHAVRIVRAARGTLDRTVGRRWCRVRRSHEAPHATRTAFPGRRPGTGKGPGR